MFRKVLIVNRGGGADGINRALHGVGGFRAGEVHTGSVGDILKSG